MAEHLNLLGKNVLVKLDEENKTTTSGIILKNAINAYSTGIVRYCSHNDYPKDGCMITSKINCGDKVLFFKSLGFEFDYEGEKLLLIEEDKILGTLI